MASSQYGFNPKKVKDYLEGIQINYDDLVGRITTRYQTKLIDSMAAHWVSINGEKAVKETVIDLNECLDSCTRVVSELFDAINSAAVEMDKSINKDSRQYSKKDFVKNFTRFNANSAKQSVNGDFYIFEADLKNDVNTFSDYYKQVIVPIHNMYRQLRNLGFIDSSGDIMSTYAGKLKNIEQNFKTRVSMAKKKVKGVIDNQTADAIAAKNRGSAALKAVSEE